MIEVEQDLWSVEADVRCITTNGTVNAYNKNIMGAGCAKEAADKFPGLPLHLGWLISQHGNHVYLLQPGLVSFPTKEDVRNPSTFSRVQDSTHELLTLAKLYGWKKIALPRPGCGLGGLDYEKNVRPMLNGLLDDRFIIVDYPKGNK